MSKLPRKLTDISRETLLLVDDDPLVISVLELALEPLGFRILWTDNAETALGIIREKTIRLVISDFRLPGMNGVDLLSAVARESPQTLRFLITSNPSNEVLIAAINGGHIDCFVPKPWDDDLLRHQVDRHIAATRALQDHEQLLAKVREQNAELTQLSAQLHRAVKDADLALVQGKQAARISVQAANDLINTLMGMIEGMGRSRDLKMAASAYAIADTLACEDHETESLVMAVLLHRIGLAGLPVKLRETPFMRLSAKQREVFLHHPVIAEETLLNIGRLRSVGRVIRCMHERWDGSGQPDGLKGKKIPIAARILAPLTHIEALRDGSWDGDTRTASAALKEAIELSESWFDPDIMVALKRRPIKKSATSTNDTKINRRMMHALRKLASAFSSKP